MKRVKIFAACLCFILLFCGCSKKTVTPVIDNIRFNAHILYYNEQYVCAVRTYTGGNFDITVLEPEVLKGLAFTYRDNGVTANYNGIEYTPNADNAYFMGVSDYIREILLDLQQKTATETDEGFAISGKTGDFVYTVYFAGSGLPLKAVVNNTITIEVLDAEIVNE